MVGTVGQQCSSMLNRKRVFRTRVMYKDPRPFETKSFIRSVGSAIRFFQISHTLHTRIYLCLLPRTVENNNPSRYFSIRDYVGSTIRSSYENKNPVVDDARIEVPSTRTVL